MTLESALEVVTISWYDRLLSDSSIHHVTVQRSIKLMLSSMTSSTRYTKIVLRSENLSFKTEDRLKQGLLITEQVH